MEHDKKFWENDTHQFVQEYLTDELFSLAVHKGTGKFTLERYKGPNYTKYTLGSNWSRMYTEDKIPYTCRVYFEHLRDEFIKHFFNPKFETIEISRKKIKGVTLRSSTLQTV